MQLIPTVVTLARFDGEHVIIPIQEDVQLRLSVHEAMSLGQSAIRASRGAIDRSRSQAEIIAFPHRAAGRA